MNNANVGPKKYFKYGLVFCLSYISSACSHQQVPIQTVFNSNNCAIKQASIKAISEQELNDLLQSIPKNFGEATLIAPEIDYEKQKLILFALGQKSTGGYSIVLNKSDARLNGETLYLPVSVQQPAANSYQIQLITSPCQIYSLPHIDYSEVVVEKE